MATFIAIGFGQSSLPRLPFSGSYGATMGAGSAVGWERSLGGNPAAWESRGFGLALAGYSPFGLDGISVLEADARADGRRFGNSLAWQRSDIQDGPSTSAWQWQGDMRLQPGLSVGGSLKILGEDGWGAALGAIWNRFPFFSAGTFAEKSFLPGDRVWRAALGADAGNSPLTPAGGKGKFGWRINGEGHFDSREKTWKWRFGAWLHLHEALSVNGGWSPEAESFALGLRFGMGNWEGFHALRRHAFLGTTSVQGVRWGTAPPDPPRGDKGKHGG